MSLEASIRINYPPDLTPEEIYIVEQGIAAGRHSGNRYAATILAVRAAARTCFGDSEPWVNYHYSVAAIGLRLMLAEDLSTAAHIRIAAATLWSTKAVAEAA